MDASQIIPDELISDILELNKALQGTDKNMNGVLKNAELLKTQFEDVSKSALSVADKQKAYNDILNKATDEQRNLLKISYDIQKVDQKISETRSEANLILEKKKNLLKEEQELTKINAVLYDKEAGTLQKAAAYNKLLEIEKKKLNLETKAGVVRLKEINEQQDKNNELIAESSNKLQAQKINVGNYKSATSDLWQSFKAGELSAKGLAKGILNVGKQLFITFISNPILIAIAAIVGVVIGLYKAFVSTDSGATAMAAKMEQLRAILDVVRQYVGSLAKGIVALFSGDKQKAAEEFGNAQKINAENFREAAKAAKEYTYALDAIEDSENNFISRSAEIKNQIARLEFTAADKTKSSAERKAALEEAMKLSGEEVEFRKKSAEEKYQAEVEYFAKKNRLTKEDVQSFIRMTNEEQENASATLKAARDNNEDKFKSLEELYAASIDADTAYFEENKKKNSKISGFNAELAKENEEAAAARKKIYEDTIKEQEETAKRVEANSKLNADIAKEENELDKWLSEQTAEINEQDMKDAEAMAAFMIGEADREYQRKKLALRAKYKDEEAYNEAVFELDRQQAENSIGTLSRELENFKGTEEQKYAIKEQLAAAQMELDTMVSDHGIATAEEEAEKKKKLQETIYEASMSVANSLFDFMDSKYAGELTALEQKNEAGLLSEKEYAAQKAEIELKQAKLARTRGIFDATINTATAIIKALADPGGIPGVILSIAAGITGGLQIASILSTPLPTVPAFGIGTTNSPSEFIAGEKGRELALLNTGQMVMFDKPTYVNDTKFKGSHIFTNAQTEAMISRTQQPNYSGNSTMSDERIVKGLANIQRTIDKKPVQIVDSRNEIIGTQSGSHREYNQKRYQRP